VAVADEFSERINFPIHKIGYGIGQRDISEVPNVLRVFISEESVNYGEGKDEVAWMTECNIDDMNPEWYDFLFQKLLGAGASDVFLTPIIMKKSRPANTLSVLCTRELLPEIKSIIFLNTTSIGLREYPVTKTVLDRYEQEIETELGKVRVKYSSFQGKVIRVKPEIEDIKLLALQHKLTLSEVEKILSKRFN